MEYINEDLGVRFVLPDDITVRQQLQYRGAVFAAGTFTNDIYIRYWHGFLGVVEEWTGAEKNGKGYAECELLPNPEDLDLDAATNPKVADIVHWVGNRTAAHMLQLDQLPKN